MVTKKITTILISLFPTIIICGVVLASQKDNSLEIKNTDLLEEFGNEGIRNTDKIPPAPFAKGGDNDDTIENQKQSITQEINLVAEIGERFFGIEKKDFFRSVNRIVELKNYKAPKIINVPEDYSEIQTAVDNANFGDTIKVASGEYLGNVVMRKGISLIGSNEIVESEKEEEKEPSSEVSELGSFSDFVSTSEQILTNETIINGNNSGNVIEFKNGITDKTKLSNFTIKNSGKNLSGIFIENSSPLINNNVLKNNEYGIYIKENSSPVIQKNVISFNNKGVQVYSFMNEEIEEEKEPSSEASELGSFSSSISALNTPTIIDNLITDNKIGIDLYNSSAIIDHNTISYNNHYKTYLGPTFGIYIAKSSAEITNNIITDNGICELCAGINADEKSKDVIISYNNIWGNKSNFVCFGKCVLEDNNFSEDPRFVNCVTSDFRLKEESGLIGVCEDGSDVGVRL